VLDECSYQRIVTGSPAKGVIRFIQLSPEKVHIEGYLTKGSGVPQGLHGVHITEFGDFSQQAESTGGHYNPTNKQHGGKE
jgi:Cu/Zn superoxide dismutase